MFTLRLILSYIDIIEKLLETLRINKEPIYHVYGGPWKELQEFKANITGELQVRELEEMAAWEVRNKDEDRV